MDRGAWTTHERRAQGARKASDRRRLPRLYAPVSVWGWRDFKGLLCSNTYAESMRPHDSGFRLASPVIIQYPKRLRPSFDP
jgi:hypothetical protein